MSVVPRLASFNMIHIELVFLRIDSSACTLGTICSRLKRVRCGQNTDSYKYSIIREFAPNNSTIRKITTNSSTIREFASKSTTRFASLPRKLARFAWPRLFSRVHNYFSSYLYLWKVYNENKENHHFLHYQRSLR